MARRVRIDPLDGWYDPDGTFRAAFGFDPKPWQVPYLRETRDTVNLKGRQVGASTSGAAVAIRYARFRPGFLAAIVSPSMKQSAEVKLRAKEGLLRIGEELDLDSQTTLSLANGSRIMSLPGTPKSVRGWSADLLIIDEAAFIEDETFLAARATVAATGGRTIVQSTPAAPFGHFHDLYEEAVDAAEAVTDEGEPDTTVRWVRYRITSEEAGTVSDEFLASERAKLTPEDFAQEYGAAFAAPGLGLVDPDKLKAATADAAEAIVSKEDDPWAVLA